MSNLLNKKDKKILDLLQKSLNNTESITQLWNIYKKITTIKTFKATIQDITKTNAYTTIQWSILNPTHTFTMQNIHWPTKIHSSLTSIITLLLTLPLNSSLDLFTPNPIVNNTLNTLLDNTNKAHPKLKTNKLPN